MNGKGNRMESEDEERPEIRQLYFAIKWTFYVAIGLTFANLIISCLAAIAAAISICSGYTWKVGYSTGDFFALFVSNSFICFLLWRVLFARTTVLDAKRTLEQELDGEVIFKFRSIRVTSSLFAGYATLVGTLFIMGAIAATALSHYIAVLTNCLMVSAPG